MDRQHSHDTAQMLNAVATPSSDAGRLMRAATYVAVAVALTLVGIKLGAWLVTDSISMLSSLVDSVMDVAASAINMIAVRQALVPADAEHRFGHSKIEPLASLGQAAFIGGSGLFVVIEAVQRLIRPEPLESGALGIGVMALSMVLTLGLVLFQRYVVQRTRSTAIRADSMHYASDILVNAGVILAFVFAISFGWYRADPIIAIVIAAVIFYSAARIAREALDHLMDRELPAEERDKIRAIAMSHARVIGCHDMRTRAAGVRAFIQLHLELPSELTLIEAHTICDEVEAAIRASYPNAEVIIHPDPEGIAEPRQSFGMR